jgi:hypothetical protein
MCACLQCRLRYSSHSPVAAVLNATSSNCVRYLQRVVSNATSYQPLCTSGISHVSGASKHCI